MCFTFLTSPASFLRQLWPGTEGKRKVPTRSEGTVGEFERWEYVEDASGWKGFQLEYRECLLTLASPPSCAGRSFKRPYSLSDLMAHLESTPLELSNDVKFVEILAKTTENTLQYSEPPYKFTYARRSHDHVQPPF